MGETLILIEFYNRKVEIQEIMNILNTRPDLITFIYGPINSGKTELINHLIRTLPKNFRVFYINLRGLYVEKSEDFLKVLFNVRGKSFKECVKYALELLPSEVITPKGKIPIPKSTLKQIFKEKEFENVFVYLESFLTEVAKKRIPVLILDELQVIGDLDIDGLLIYKLFNLFIRLTKELHCCHVFAVTSDSLFIERVYSEAMLQGRCDYLLVDDFDYETTKGFLKKYGFSEDEIKLTWNYFGGKPVYLVKAVKNRHRLKEMCEEMLRIRVRQIKDFVYDIEERDKDVYERILELFEEFKDCEVLEYERLTKEIRLCVKSNILFVDPAKSIVIPQSKLDLLAIIRSILRDVKKKRVCCSFRFKEC
jgi:AAA+ ATPase superfamily predicted ATPase